MTALSAAFGPFAGRIWLNCAHQGPLPLPAAEAAQHAIADKLAPARIADDAFWAVPERLRTRLAELVGGKPEEVVLGNATSYGLNLLAQGLRLSADDEVLVVQGDFPATVVPWLQLADRGVAVRFLGDGTAQVDADTLAAAITRRTRVFCTSWVFSFLGHALDLAALGQVCHDNGVLFIVNGSQAVGARPVDVSQLPIDALCCCGFKWLCGPYATGFAWIAGELMARLDYPQPYWLSMQEGGDLNSELDYTLTERHDGAAHDIYGTANFFNYEPWIAALDHLASFGADVVAAYDQALVDRLLDGLDELPYRLISPRRGPQRSTLVLFSHQDAQRNRPAWAALTDAGIDAALRNDTLRISPHLYNSEDDIDAALTVLTHTGRLTLRLAATAARRTACDRR
jgi:cysteine desulfurase / selenocysteine lyase